MECKDVFCLSEVGWWNHLSRLTRPLGTTQVRLKCCTVDIPIFAKDACALIFVWSHTESGSGNGIRLDPFGQGS